MRIALVLAAGLALPSAGARADDPPQGWDFVGRTQAAATVEVRARATGYVTRVPFVGGSRVKKGDVLVEIDPRPYRLALDGALARVKETEARLMGARIKAADAKKLGDSKVISPAEVALAAATEAEAVAALGAAKAEAERAELALSWTRVAAPFDGRVSRVQASEGGLAVADQTPLLTVVSVDRLHVSFKVPEALFVQLNRDGLADPVKLHVAIGFAGEKGLPHEAKLDLIDSVVDSATGTVQFRATIPNPKGLLLPGMSARVRLTPPPK